MSATEKSLDSALVWFRRDLRTDDNAALHHALRSAREVWCAFVFDTEILDVLPRADRRVEFLVQCTHDLDASLAALGQANGRNGTRLLVRHGKAADEIVALAHELHVQAVFANHDDDPYALTRDAQRMLHGQFATHSAGRTYRAIVMGQPRNDRDTLNSKLGRGEDGRRAVVEEDDEGKDSITHFTVLNRYAQGAELEVVLETGRTHQIRVTLADIACPVYGDNVYAFKPRKNQVFGPRSPRLMLHAEELSFDHPSTGKRITVKAPIPAAFAEFIEQIKVPAVAAWQRPQAPALDDPSQARAPAHLFELSPHAVPAATGV